jgi:hypothetical protein
MRKGTQLAFIALMAVIFAPAVARAQASITGVVKDTSGAVLPGVTVEAGSPALIEKVRSAITDGTGQYRIVDLRPGTYTVTFTLPGFNTVKREGVALTGTFTASIDADMRVGALEETITVTGETPIVDVQSATRQRVIDRDVIDSIPTSRMAFTLAVLIPGVTGRTGPGTGLAQDTGGNGGTQQGNTLVVHGSKPDSLRMAYNGLTIATLETGRNTGSVYNLAGFGEVAVDYSAVSAEMATGGVRINLIPRDGGNTYSGELFVSGMKDKMQASNYTEELRSRGLRTPSELKQIWDINPSLGGPFKRDTLWFFATGRYVGNEDYPADIFYNKNEGNPNAWTYEPDPARGRPFNRNAFGDAEMRLTWQANQKNKIAFLYDWQYYDNPSGVSATSAPENISFTRYPVKRNAVADWSSPITNRLLLEAVASQQYMSSIRTLKAPLIAVTEQSTGLTYRGKSGTSRNSLNSVWYYRAALSYITGAHALKVGFNNGQGHRGARIHDYNPVDYRFNNGVPNQITLRATPTDEDGNLDADMGIYAQDKWTMDRLTLGLGVRFDYYKTSYPEMHLGPVPLVPLRDITIPPTPGVTGWKDITPKLMATYDLFGTGKTAVKVSLNKYVGGMTLGSDLPFGVALSPVSKLITQTNRSWNDANRNFIPDCNLINPLANGECGAMANRNFGTFQSGSTYDSETLGGWGTRAYNWEFSTGLQHEVLPRVSADVGFFRRWYGNFIVSDDRALSASDFDRFTITAPSDSRLPGGGGYTIDGLYNLKPEKFGTPADLYVTFADDFGRQIEHWNGVDVGLSARLENGLTMQGGLSTGRLSLDNCEVVSKLPETLLSAQNLDSVTTNVWLPASYCRQESPFLTQFKALGSYTVPKVDALVSASLQSVPGDQTLANYNLPTAVAARTLGRPLSGAAANMTLQLLEPGTMYGERINQLDLRFGKVLRFGRTRTTVSLDVYNATNSNTALSVNPNFAAFLRPTSILVPRMFKISGQFGF